MSVRRSASAFVFLIALLTPAFTVSAQTEITPADVAAADDERRAVSAELESTTVLYDQALARLIELENSLTALGIELAEREQELAFARVAAKEVAVDRYKHAGASGSVLFDSATIEDVPLRAGYLDILSREGTDTVIRLFALEDSYRAQQLVVEQALASQVETNTELEALATSILERLEAANRNYDAIVSAYEIQEEEKRRRAEEERRRQEEEERRRREATSTTTTTVAPTTTVATTTSTVPASTSSEAPEDTTTSVPEDGTTTSTTTTEPPLTTTTQPPPSLVMSHSAS